VILQQIHVSESYATLVSTLSFVCVKLMSDEFGEIGLYEA
jgi:hypothetical protein